LLENAINTWEKETILAQDRYERLKVPDYFAESKTKERPIPCYSEKKLNLFQNTGETVFVFDGLHL
jgi:hypothetical protein